LELVRCTGEAGEVLAPLGQRNDPGASDLAIPGQKGDSQNDAGGGNDLVRRIAPEVEIGRGAGYRQVEGPRECRAILMS
jgi:hypothetical protein